MNLNLVPISEARVKLPELVRSSTTADVYLMRHGKPTALLIGVDRYEALLEEIEDLKDRVSVYESREHGPEGRISFDALEAELVNAAKD